MADNLDLTPDVADLLKSYQIPSSDNGDGAPEAKPKRRPHDKARRYRQASITFPDDLWLPYLQDLADRQDLRLSDLVVWLIAVALAEIQADSRPVPSGAGRQEHHRACGWFDLPFSPGGNAPD